MLTFIFLAKSLIDLDVDRLAAPFEFLAAAARARPIGIKSHVFFLPIGSVKRTRDWSYNTEMSATCKSVAARFRRGGVSPLRKHESNGTLLAQGTYAPLRTGH